MEKDIKKIQEAIGVEFTDPVIFEDDIYELLDVDPGTIPFLMGAVSPAAIFELNKIYYVKDVMVSIKRLLNDVLREFQEDVDFYSDAMINLSNFMVDKKEDVADESAGVG